MKVKPRVYKEGDDQDGETGDRKRERKEEMGEIFICVCFCVCASVSCLKVNK